MGTDTRSVRKEDRTTRTQIRAMAKWWKETGKPLGARTAETLAQIEIRETDSVRMTWQMCQGPEGHEARAAIARCALGRISETDQAVKLVARVLREGADDELMNVAIWNSAGDYATLAEPHAERVVRAIVKAREATGTRARYAQGLGWMWLGNGKKAAQCMTPPMRRDRDGRRGYGVLMQQAGKGGGKPDRARLVFVREMVRGLDEDSTMSDEIRAELVEGLAQEKWPEGHRLALKTAGQIADLGLRIEATRKGLSAVRRHRHKHPGGMAGGELESVLNAWARDVGEAITRGVGEHIASFAHAEGELCAKLDRTLSLCREKHRMSADEALRILESGMDGLGAGGDLGSVSQWFAEATDPDTQHPGREWFEAAYHLLARWQGHGREARSRIAARILAFNDQARRSETKTCRQLIHAWVGENHPELAPGRDLVREAADEIVRQLTTYHRRARNVQSYRTRAMCEAGRSEKVKEALREHLKDPDRLDAYTLDLLVGVTGGQKPDRSRASTRTEAKIQAWLNNEAGPDAAAAVVELIGKLAEDEFIERAQDAEAQSRRDDA